MARAIQLRVNGTTHRITVEPERSLLSVLRDELNLTGTKYGCGEGACGACTVLIDSKHTKSCITAVSEVAGKNIVTIEGLEKNGRLHSLQEAFLKADAMQCAYCTSGMIMAATELLAVNPQPSREDVINHMNGNVCRCGAYERIISAIQIASRAKVGQ